MSTNTIYTMECSRCKHITHVSASNTAHAKSQAGHCSNCKSQGVTWGTWHIR